MPKPIRKTVGHVTCPIEGCALKADVRRQKDHESGRPYVVCPVHQKLSAAKWLDDYIDKNAVWNTSEPEPVEVKKETSTPEPKPEPQKKAGIFDGWW